LPTFTRSWNKIEKQQVSEILWILCTFVVFLEISKTNKNPNQKVLSALHSTEFFFSFLPHFPYLFLVVINLNKSGPKQTPVNSIRLKESPKFRWVLKAGKACGKCEKSLPKLWPFNIRRSDDWENRI